MKIAHFVGHSMVRFTPGRIASLWGKYTPHEGRAFSLNRPGGWDFEEPLNPEGFFCCRSSPKGEVRDYIAQADVLHFHDDSYPTVLENRSFKYRKDAVLVYHAHIGSIPERYFQPKNPRYKTLAKMRYGCITNGYGHIFNHDTKLSKGIRQWGRLADILDLNHPTYKAEPGLRDPVDGPLKVVYTYSNNNEGSKINAKRPKSHRSLAERIPGVTFKMITGKPFEEAMALKKTAHVVLEECFSPYLHLSALEGAAVGTMVLTKTNASTRKELSDYVGAPVEEWPFYECNEKNLRSTLKELAENRDLVEEWGRRGYDWMQRYYQPETLLGKYLEFYGYGEDPGQPPS